MKILTLIATVYINFTVMGSVLVQLTGSSLTAARVRGIGPIQDGRLCVTVCALMTLEETPGEKRKRN